MRRHDGDPTTKCGGRGRQRPVVGDESSGAVGAFRINAPQCRQPTERDRRQATRAAAEVIAALSPRCGCPYIRRVTDHLGITGDLVIREVIVAARLLSTGPAKLAAARPPRPTPCSRGPHPARPSTSPSPTRPPTLPDRRRRLSQPGQIIR